MIRFFCMFASLAIPVAASASEPAQPATPVGNPGTWVTSDDYPMEAMRQEIEGATSFRLDIDRDGIPTNCKTTSSSGAAILDETACAKAMERARFSPAKDASGSAVSGTFTARINWRLPDTSALFSSPSITETTFTINPDGSPSDCRTMIDGNIAPDQSSCLPIMGKVFRFRRTHQAILSGRKCASQRNWRGSKKAIEGRLFLIFSAHQTHSIISRAQGWFGRRSCPRRALVQYRVERGIVRAQLQKALADRA